MRSCLVLCGLIIVAGNTFVLASDETPEETKVAAATKKPVPKKKAAAPAKELFGAAKSPAPMAARAIGFYAKGCLAGGAALPIDGPAWQAMRLSRNRNWGHPELVGLVERLANEAKKHDGWPGLLVGDLSQPRGGPMLTGHASHQVGLDADIWLTPMPNRRLTDKEREELSATSMLAADKISVDAKVWTDAHVRLIRRAASYSAVERLFVHPAIKKALCDATAKDKDRSWLHKVRPMWGHHYHFHIRIDCPKGSGNCEAQPAPPSDDGCGKELSDWIALLQRPPRPPGPPAPPKPPLTLDQLPVACKSVLASGSDKRAPVEKPAAAAAAAGKPTITKTK
jgi:penicillin-insensitive murein DD-endopeptidase